MQCLLFTSRCTQIPTFSRCLFSVVILLLEDEMQRFSSAPASLQQESRIKTRREGRRLKTQKRRNGKEAFLQGSVLLPPFLIAAGRQIRLKVVPAGSQVVFLLQLLHVTDVLQDHTAGCSSPVPRGDGQGSCWHVEGLAAGCGGLQLTESDVLGQVCLAGCCGSLPSMV